MNIKEQMKLRMKHIISLIAIFITGWLQAQNLPNILVQPDTTQIRIGEQIRLSVKAQADTLSFVDFPELTALGDMEVVKTTPVDTLQSKPYRHLQKDYYITQWDSGNYVVPPINIKINDSIFVTDSLTIKVLPVQIDTTKQGLYGFKEPVNIEGKPAGKIIDNSLSKWWWLLLLVPVLAIAYYFYHKRQQKIAARKAITPYETANNSLQKLSQDKLWLQNKIDKHYLRLTDTLKDYLENELLLHAKEKISNELLQELKKYRFENGAYFKLELLQRLEQTLKRADLAKFAKLTPEPADIDLDFNVVKDVIDFAHQIVQNIADEKAAEIARIETNKKRKKRIAIITASTIVFIIGVIIGTGYYYLKKLNLTDNLIENISKAEWAYGEYGSTPALGLTTPHILHDTDISETLDTLSPIISKLYDEIAIYTDQNPIKKYVIVAGSFDAKQKIPEKTDITKLSMYGILKQIKARKINLQEADIEESKRYFGNFITDIPILGDNLKIRFDSRFYQTEKGEKFVIGMYLDGNKDNEALIDRVMQSAELVN